MLWIGFNFVGLQLLLLVYTAQSFVLLTANIQDLKNLARKFVSDSVADQLAKLVVKATGQMSEIMGETSGKNRIKSHDISGSNEYELRNIERKGEEKEKQARYTKGDNQEYITRTTGNEERQRPNYFSNESKEKSAEREDRLLENEKTWQKSSKEISTEQTEKQDKSKARNWRDKLEKLKESEHPISTKPKNAWSMEKNEVSNNDVFSQEGPKNSFISQFVGSQDDKSKEHYRPIKQSQKFESKILDERMTASAEMPSAGSRYKKTNDHDPKTLTLEFKSPNSQKTEKKHDARESESKTLDERMSASAETPSSGSRYKKINDYDAKTLTFDFKQLESQKTEKKQDVRKSESKTLDERMSASVETPSSGSRYKKVNNQDSKTLTFDFKQPNSQKTEKKHDVRKSESKTLAERMSASVETPLSGSRYKKVNNQDSKTLTFDFKQPNSQKTEKKHDAREYESKTLDERMSASAETPSSGSRYKKINDHDSKTLTFDFKQANSQKTEKPHEARESSVERYFSSRYKKIDDRNFKMTALSNESNSKSDDDALWDLETTRFRGVPLDNSEGITTIKEKTDFDQYDNRNYPKAEFIATSGQLMLPRLSSNDSKKPKPDAESWWEKNLKPSADQLKSWQLYKV